MNQIDHLPLLGSGRGRALLAVALLTAAALGLLLAPEAALAVRDVGDGGGTGGSVNAEAAGKNLSELLRGMAQPVLYVLAAICGIGMVLRQQYMLLIGLIAGCMLLTVLMVDAGADAIEAMANEFAKALGG